MNNIKLYTEFIQKVDTIIYEKIGLDILDVPIDNIIEVLNHLQKSFEELREMVINLSFSDTDEEIYFFRYVKPELLSKLLYYTEIYNIETKRPNGSNEVIIQYYNKNLDELTLFFKKNLDFYQYYRSKATYLDAHYFVRGQKDFRLCANCTLFDKDPLFSTGYDHKIAKILANEMCRIYINKKMNDIDKQTIINKSRASLPDNPFRWTGTKVAAIELGYAIYAMGVLNNGNADIKDIMTFMEASFKIDLGDYYRTYITIRDRKKDRTIFLTGLIQALLKKMDEDDAI